jgi:hypothetical protein
MEQPARPRGLVYERDSELFPPRWVRSNLRDLHPMGKSDYDADARSQESVG